MAATREHTVRNRAIIRADASVSVGGGHVRRCLVLAEALAEAGWHTTFATRPEALETVPWPAGSTFVHMLLNHDDEVRQLQARAPQGCDLLIVDHYGIDAHFERACRGWAKRILVVDDLADRRHDCDILVDQAPGRSASAYTPLVPPGCAILVGPAYALLDPRFRAARRQTRPVAKRVGRVLVSFGSTDAGDMTSIALEALRIAELGAETDVVLGRSSPNLGRVRAIASTLSPAPAIHVAVDDMAAMMKNAHLAIGAGGVSSLERCCLGLPSVLLVAADNQRHNAEGLMAAGAALVLGLVCEPGLSSLARAIRELGDDPARRQAMADAGRALCDGGGAARIVDVLEHKGGAGWSGGASAANLG